MNPVNENENVKIRYVAGAVMPIGTEVHPLPQPQPLLPPDVVRIPVSIDIKDYTREGVDEAIANRYWPCVDRLLAQNAKSITLCGLPIASQLGRKRVLELAMETERRTGVAADSQSEQTIDAVKHFGARRIAIASRWSDELNDRLKAYFAEAGIDVLTVTTAGQWAKQAFSMSIEQGVKLAFQLGREAMRKAPDAEVLLLAGGAWRSLAAVPILEEDYGIPVITNPIAEVWRIIAEGVAPPVEGWGRLLAMK